METSPSQTREVRFDEAGATQMDRTAVEIFAPIYPILANQIVRRLGITRGRLRGNRQWSGDCSPWLWPPSLT